MFSYYGSKSKIIDLYPAPKFGTIIEEFAGSARFSLRYWDHDVFLYDLSDYVCRTWEYLINATERDIRSLPLIPSKLSIKNWEGLSEGERYLIGFHLCRGKAKPRHTGHGQNSWARDRERIAQNLYKVKHWKIEQRSYETIPNIEATHFIDPPYEFTQNRPGNSDRYPHGSNLDYPALAEYVRSRKGQVIVCEGDKRAKWLPFEPLVISNANSNNREAKMTAEFIYHNSK